MTPREPRLTELALIRALRERARQAPGVRVGIGDDCAVLEAPGGGLLLATTDLLIEDVHFRRRYAEPADIGWKALAVNVSDIASMGGRPRWALIALACPASTTMDEVEADRKSTRLNSSHRCISYAVFCLKKKKKKKLT